ncbi:hypothetical protein ETG59_11880 [Proteus mirabilis]|uniref:hypothetical protein n=1 Tax=Proteus mirabilis TaxID=584 RepID=UPI0019CFA3B5|nr:hypothetical protein [Proteus mirabilis]MBI6486506.1 hypothetical protein [Proteus mirabilis]MBN7151012.1 hypothetical protein [Proteus mirabilis]MBN7154571.1 hypothetical protein [Proteus mirabilis]MBN7167334.1 hypothetical protein [Proteus mirabilis]MBN7171032.1 hypothetical protein [Proteus mirabilis]
MNKQEYWQNFNLGNELDIACNFLYDGLNNFHQIQHFGYETEIFNFLYNISVGVERFLKIAIILVEYNNIVEQDSFEKSFITHNHSDLMARYKKNRNINLAPMHNDFLMVLSKFYKTYRYDRYGLNSVQAKTEKDLFLDYLYKYDAILKEKHFFDLDDEIISNSEKTKLFIGKVLSNIILQLYDSIVKSSRGKNIYTYEIRYNSKASYLLHRKKFNFIDKDIMWKELIIFILNTDKSNYYLKFIKNIEPLDLDIALLKDYISSFNSTVHDSVILDELEHLYSKSVRNFDIHERLEKLSILAHPYAILAEDEDEDEDEDFYY